MRKYLTLETVVTLSILLFIGVLAVEGLVVEKLSPKAMAFPGFVFGAAGIIGLFEIIRVVRQINRSEAMEKTEKSVPPAVFKNRRNFIEFVAMTICYFLLMYLLGFLPASIIFCAVYGMRKKYERMGRLIIAAVAVNLLWYLLFSKVFVIRIPNAVLLKWIM